MSYIKPYLGTLGTIVVFLILYKYAKPYLPMAVTNLLPF
jgi:hypothetical protein